MASSLVEQAVLHFGQHPDDLRDFCGWHVLKEPRPMPAERLADLTFPSGKPLPPSLRAWLAFDTSWLAEFGWFDDSGALAPRSLVDILREEYGGEGMPGSDTDFSPADLWLSLDHYFPECFLLPDGTDSRRIFAVTTADSA